MHENDLCEDYMKAHCIICGVEVPLTLSEMVADEVEYRKVVNLESDEWEGVLCEPCRLQMLKA